MKRVSQPLVCGLLAALALGCLRRAGAPVPAEPYDESLERAVEEVLAADELPVVGVDVASERGVVTLGGKVDSLLLKNHAQAVTETVRGVRSVVNLLQVDPKAPVSDAALAQHVRDALRFQPATRAADIAVAVEEGHVALRGRVASMAEAKLAECVAAGVDGVRAVASELALAPAPARSDREIEADVQARLVFDPWIDASLVRVEVKRARVALSGTVGRVAELNRAAAHAWVRGVKEVELQHLDVEPWARMPERRAEPVAQRPPGELEHVVELTLRQDPRVRGDDIDVQAIDSAIVLRGAVSDLFARRAAERDALSVLGVERVDNQLVLEPPPAADEHIAAEVRTAIARHALLDARDILVDAREGTVHLRGTVDSELARDVADQLASQAPGVLAVWNELVVAPRCVPSDRDPTQECEPVGVYHRPSSRQDIPEQGMRTRAPWSIALARCQQQQRCGFLGLGGAHPSLEACVAAVMERERARLAAFACDTDAREQQLGLCLTQVRTLDCALPFEAIDDLGHCDPRAVCPDGV